MFVNSYKGKNRLWLNKIKVTLQNFNSLFKFDFDVLNIKTGETLQLLAIMTAALLRFLYGGTRTRLGPKEQPFFKSL